jgi:hypothetical protein
LHHVHRSARQTRHQELTPSRADLLSFWSPDRVERIVPIALPLLWALLGPIPNPPVFPEAVLPEPDAPAVEGLDAAIEGWRPVLGGCAGLAVGAGTPAAVVGAGSGVLAWMYPQAFAGTLTGIGPALFALGTVEAMIFSAACFPMCGSLLATAGAAWGAQAEGRDPGLAVAGAVPGLALAVTSTALSAVAMGMGVFGGFGLAVPILDVTSLAVLTGLPAPLVAFMGAALADAAWPEVKATARRARQTLGLSTDEDAAMAY